MEFITPAAVPYILPLIQTELVDVGYQFACWKFHICNRRCERRLCCIISPLIAANIDVTWDPTEDNCFVHFQLIYRPPTEYQTDTIFQRLTRIINGIVKLYINWVCDRRLAIYLRRNKPRGAYQRCCLARRRTMSTILADAIDCRRPRVWSSIDQQAAVQRTNCFKTDLRQSYTTVFSRVSISRNLTASPAFVIRPQRRMLNRIFIC